MQHCAGGRQGALDGFCSHRGRLPRGCEGCCVSELLRQRIMEAMKGFQLGRRAVAEQLERVLRFFKLALQNGGPVVCLGGDFSEGLRCGCPWP